MTRVLAKFESHYRAALPSLRNELERGDPAVLQQLAHSVRGAASTIGARGVAELAGRLETTLAGQRPADEAKHAGQALLDALAALVDALAAAARA